MTLVVETGSGLPNANSYVEVAFADDWMLALGDTLWATTPQADKERHLIIGAFYVSNGQIYYYSGAKQVYGQSLAWPRIGAFYRNGGPAVPLSTIPTEIQIANVVAAQASLHGVLPTTGIWGDGTGGGGGAAKEVKSEKVGDLSVEYFDPLRNTAASSAGSSSMGADALARMGFPAVTGIVAPLLNEEFYALPVDGSRAPIVGPSFNSPPPPQFWLGFQDSTASFLATPANVATVRGLLARNGYSAPYGPHG